MAAPPQDATTRCPSGILYSPGRVETLRAILEDLFTHDWLVRPQKRTLLQRLWQSEDPYDLIRLCRIGRDVEELLSLGEAAQEVHIHELAARIKRLDNDAGQVRDLLYELHVATMFYPPSGLTGRLARNGQEGYDVTVSFPDERMLWISCKRLTLTEYHARFDSAAETLRRQLRSAARECGLGAVSGLVATADTINGAAAHLAALWESVCVEHRRHLEWVVREQRPHLVAVGPGPMITADDPGADLGIPPATIAICAGVPRPDIYKRFQRVYKDAVDALMRQMTRGHIPPPSNHAAWMVAMEVPDSLALKDMHRYAEQDAERDRLAGLSAFLLTCSTPAAYGWPPHTYTMVEELSLLLNGKARMPLPDFIGATPFVLVHEGQHVVEEVVRYAVLGESAVAIPHGFYSAPSSVIAARQDRVRGGLPIPSVETILPDPPPPVDGGYHPI